MLLTRLTGSTEVADEGCPGAPKLLGKVAPERRSCWRRLTRGAPKLLARLLRATACLWKDQACRNSQSFVDSDTGWEDTAKPGSANFGPTQKMVRNRRQYQTRTFRDTWPACFRPMPMTEANRLKFRPCSRSLIKQRTTPGNCGGSASCDIQKGHSLKQGLRSDRKCFPCQQEQPWRCVASSSEVPRGRRRDLLLAALLLRLCGALCVLAVASSLRTLCASSG